MRNMNGGNNNWGSQWSANNKGGKKQKRCGADSGSCHDKCQMLNTLLRLFLHRWTETIREMFQ